MTALPHREHKDELPREAVWDLQDRLGIQRTPVGGRYSAAWDSIAVECGLPTTADLLTGMDGGGIEVLPHWLWNRAVDIANQRPETQEPT